MRPGKRAISFKKPRLFLRQKILFILMGCMASNSNWAVTKDWLGANNNWFDGINNWSPIGTPAPVDDVTININAAFAQLENNQSAAINSLTIGQNALDDGLLNIINGGALSVATTSVLGVVANSRGEVNVSGVGSLWNTNTALTLGLAGDGILMITDGGVVNSLGVSILGYVFGGAGEATVTGIGSLWQTDTGLTVGFAGTGILNIMDHGTVTDNSAVIADDATSTAVVNVSDGSQWRTNTFLLVANNGIGGLNVFDGGSVSTGDMTLGNGTGTGTVIVNGGFLNVAGLLNVGGSGNALLQIQGGGVVSDNVQAIIGEDLSANGVATIQGAGSLWQTADLFVGFHGTGAMLVSNGGSVASNQGTLGGFTGSSGTVTVSDPGSQWSASVLFVGNIGTGMLNIINGGTVTTSQGTAVGANTGNGDILIDGLGSTLNTASLRIGSVANGEVTVQNNGAARVSLATVLGNGPAVLQLLSNGILETPSLIGSSASITTNFDGGILRATTENKAFIQGFTPGQLVLNGTGLVIDSNGFRIATSDVFSGAGGLTKAGAGIFTLRGNQAYTGLTSVRAGILDVKGVLGGAVDVEAAGTLQGTGTVGPTTVQGVVAPGNPTNQGDTIGTLSVNGNFSQLSGSIYQTEINPLRQSDLVNIAGIASLNGATVDVIVSPGVYTSGTTYTILTAQGGISGTYNNVVDTLPFLDLFLSYDAQNVYLGIARNNVPLATAALTVNQFNTAVAVDGLGIGNPVFDAVSSLSSVYLAPQAFDSLSGEIHASTLGALMEESRYVRYASLNRLQQSFTEDDTILMANQFRTASGITFWGQGFGSWGDMDSNGNAATLDRHSSGLFLGGDTLLKPESRLGFVFGLSNSEFDVRARNSSASSDGYYAAMYGGTKVYSLNARAGAAYGWHNIDTRRAINFQGFSDYVKSYAQGETKQIYGELGYPWQVKFLNLEPFLGGAFVDVDIPFQEWGGAAGLSGTGQEDVFYSTLGLRESASLINGEKLHIAERLMLGWQHAVNHLNPQSLMNFNSGNQNFIIYGVPIAKNSVLIDAGLVFKRPQQDNLLLKLAYIGQWASQVHDHGLSGTIAYRMD